MAGRSLRELLAAQSPREGAWVQRLADAAGRAFEPIHAAGGAHGSVRPETLAVDDSGGSLRVELLPDDRAQRAAEPDRYVAPEVAKGGAAGPKADLFALGVCLYEAVTGRMPFRVMDTAMVPSNPRDYAPAIDPKFSLIIRHLLAADPGVRLSDGACLLEKLDELEHPEDPPSLSDFPSPVGPRGQIQLEGETTDEFYVRMEHETAEHEAVTRDRLTAAPAGGNGDDETIEDAGGSAQAGGIGDEETLEDAGRAGEPAGDPGPIEGGSVLIIEDDEEPLTIQKPKKSKAPLIAALVILLLIALGVGSWFFYQKYLEDQRNAAIAEHLKSARENLHAKKFDAADGDVNQVFHLDADNAPAKKLKGKIGQARAAWLKKQKEIARLLAKSREALGETKFAEARTHATGVFDYEPDHAGAKKLLAEIDRAEKDAARRAALEKADALVKEGRARFGEKKLDEADAKADAALNLVAGHAGAKKLKDDAAAARAAANVVATKAALEAKYGQALDHYNKGELDPAEKLVKEVLAADAAHAGAKGLLARIQADRARLAHFRKLMDLAKKNAGAFQWKRAAGAVGKAEKVLKTDETGRFRDSAHGAAMAKARKAEGAQRLDEAIAHVEGALALKDDPAARAYLKKLQDAAALARQGSAFLAAWKAAEKHRQKREWDKALEKYNVALKHAADPEPVKARIKEVETERDLERNLATARAAYEEAKTHRKERERKEARDAYGRASDAYEKALKLRDDGDTRRKLALTYLMRGLMNGLLGRRDDSIADYTQAIRVRPDYTLAFNQRGKAQVMAGRFQDSIADFSEAIKLRADFAEAWQNRGFAYRKLENYKQAVRDYTEAIKRREGYSLAYNNRGAARIKLGQIDEALEDLTTAIKLKPGDHRAYVNRAYAHLEKGEAGALDLAMADCQAALKRKPNMSEALFYRGLVHQRKGMARLALQDFNGALQSNPNNPNALIARGRLYHENRSKQKARADFEKALEIEPDHEAAKEIRELLAK